MALLIICDIDHTLKLQNVPWHTPAVPGALQLLRDLLAANDPRTTRIAYVTNRFGPMSTLTLGRWSPRRFLFREHSFPAGPLFPRHWSDFDGYISRSPNHKSRTLDHLLTTATLADWMQWERDVLLEADKSSGSKRSRDDDDDEGGASSTTPVTTATSSSSSSTTAAAAKPEPSAEELQRAIDFRRVVMLGDSVEKDAWIYAQFCKRNPTVPRMYVCVRLVNMTADKALAERLLGDKGDRTNDDEARTTTVGASSTSGGDAIEKSEHFELGKHDIETSPTCKANTRWLEYRDYDEVRRFLSELL